MIWQGLEQRGGHPEADVHRKSIERLFARYAMPWKAFKRLPKFQASRDDAMLEVPVE